MRTLIHHANVITPFRVIRDGAVLLEDRHISEVFEGGVPLDGAADKTIDAGGLYLSPGFIDIHVHGGGGVDATEADAEAIVHMCESHARYGTASGIFSATRPDAVCAGALSVFWFGGDRHAICALKPPGSL